MTELSEKSERVLKYIPATYWPVLCDKISAIQKKAQKMGVPIPRIELTGKDRLDRIATKDGRVDKVRMVEIDVIGDMPVYNGWKFLAKIEHSQHPDKLNQWLNTFMVAPYLSNDENKAVSLKALTCPPDCDHCSSKRFRSETFVAENTETKEVIQLGSSCVDKYLGNSSLAAIALNFQAYSIMDLLKDPDDEMSGPFYSGSRSEHIETIVALSTFLTLKFGFAKTSSDVPTPTVLLMKQLLNGSYNNWDKEDRDIIREIFEESDRYRYALRDGSDEDFQPKNKYVVDAIKVLNKLKEIEPENAANSYMMNLGVLAKRGVIEVSDNFALGILASAPNYYYKELEKELARKRNIENNNMATQTFGEEKQRGSLKLTLTKKVEDFNGEFGYMKFSFMDDEGRNFMWQASIGSAPELNQGKTYAMTATINGFFDYKHGDMAGQKCTKISRCNNIIEVDLDYPVPTFIEEKLKKKKQKAADQELSS